MASASRNKVLQCIPGGQIRSIQTLIIDRYHRLTGKRLTVRKCSALGKCRCSLYDLSMSKNSARSFTDDSERMSIALRSEIMNVVKN